MSHPEGSPHRRVIVAVAIGAALVPLNSTMVAVALPDMGNDLGVGPGTLTLWLVTSYLLVNVILQSPSGKLGDLLGRRRTYVTGQTILGLGALVAVLASHLAVLTAARILMAMGGAMLVPTAMALLRNVIREDLRPRAFSYFGTLLGASAASGPLIGGLLTRHFGWRSIFLVNIPLLILSSLLSRRSDAAWGDSRRRNVPPADFDFLGMLLLAVGLAGAVLGAKVGGSWTAVLITIAAVALVGFVVWERRVSSPLVDPALFKRLPFVVGGSVVALQNLAMYALLFQLPFLLRDWVHLEADHVGQTLSAMTLGMLAFSPAGGFVAERLGTKLTLLGGLVLSTLGLTGLSFVIADQERLSLMATLALVGAGIGIVTGPSQAAAMSAVERSSSGSAAGVMSTLRYVGGIAGIAIISVLLADIEPSNRLARHELCISIYIGAHLMALILALGLPAHVRRGS